MIYPVHPSAVLKEWPRALPFLKKAFEHSQDDEAGRHLPLLLSDQEQLWHIQGKASAITRVVQSKQALTLHYVALGGGEMNEWISDFLRESETWAKRHGCTHAVVVGRPGWERCLPSYRKTHITLSKEL